MPMYFNNNYCTCVITLQTMGGTFSGKQQDCSKGIYAMAGRSRQLLKYSEKVHFKDIVK